MTNLTFVLKKMEDQKKGTLCLGCFTFALEEKERS
jgi:hypothetical protein